LTSGDQIHISLSYRFIDPCHRFDFTIKHK